MVQSTPGEIIEGLWRFEALHPEWTEDEGGDEDGWEQQVAWWAIATPHGLVLIDPLVDDGTRSINSRQTGAGAPGRAHCHWHQRSVSDVASRYSADVWAKQHGDGRVPDAFDRAISDGDELFDELRVFDVERADEIAVWLPRQAALVFADASFERAPVTFESVRSHGHNLRAARQGYVHCSALSQCSRLSTFWCLTVRWCWVAEARPCGLPRVERLASPGTPSGASHTVGMIDRSPAEPIAA